MSGDILLSINFWREESLPAGTLLWKKIQTPSLLGNHPNLEMDKKAIE